MTQVFGTNHRAKLSKPKAISDYPRHSNENYSNIIIVWVPRLCLRLCLRLGHFDSHNAVHTDFSTQIRWSPHRWLAVWVVGDGLTLLEFCVTTTLRPRISGRSIVSIRRNIVNPALTTSILKRNSIIFKELEIDRFTKGFRYGWDLKQRKCLVIISQNRSRSVFEVNAIVYKMNDYHVRVANVKSTIFLN